MVLRVYHLSDIELHMHAHSSLSNSMKQCYYFPHFINEENKMEKAHCSKLSDSNGGFGFQR